MAVIECVIVVGRCISWCAVPFYYYEQTGGTSRSVPRPHRLHIILSFNATAVTTGEDTTRLLIIVNEAKVLPCSVSGVGLSASLTLLARWCVFELST